MSVCKLCQKEKVVSLTFCGSLCKEVYHWIEGETKKRSREEYEEKERKDFVELFPDEINFKILYDVPLNTMAAIAEVNKYFNGVYKDKSFQQYYVKNNYAKMDDMLLDLLNAGNSNAFFTWYNALEVFENERAKKTNNDLMILPNENRFQIAFSKLFSDLEKPANFEAFERSVPKAINLGLWKASGTNGSDVLQAVVGNIWPNGVKILLSSNYKKRDALPTNYAVDRQFSRLVASLADKKGTDAYKKYKDQAIETLEAMLDSKLVTLSFGGILTLEALAELGYSNVLKNALTHATNVEVAVDLDNKSNRENILKQAFLSRDEWTFIELIGRQDWDFMDAVTSDMVSDCIRLKFFTAIKQLVREIPDVINLRFNGQPYVTAAINHGCPQIALFLLKQPGFPELNESNATFFSDKVYKIIRHLNQPSEFEDRGQAQKARQKLKKDYWELKQYVDQFRE